MATASVVRGCGTRQPGGVYLVSALGEGGVPLRDCVVDPPVAVDASAAGLSPQGMTLGRGSGGRIVVLDWVGQEAYPNPADFVEEVALFGSSRRVPVNFDFASLGPGARHVLLHPRAVLANHQWLLGHRAPWGAEHRLPGAPAPPGPGRASSAPSRATATSTPWAGPAPPTGGRRSCPPRSSSTATSRASKPSASGSAWCSRHMPSFGYEGYTLPDRDVWAPEWALGAFLALPLTRIEVVPDPGDLAHVVALEKARKAALPVVEVAGVTKPPPSPSSYP